MSRRAEECHLLLVFEGRCQSWYLKANGEAISWLWSLNRFRRDRRKPVLSDYGVG